MCSTVAALKAGLRLVRAPRVDTKPLECSSRHLRSLRLSVAGLGAWSTEHVRRMEINYRLEVHSMAKRKEITKINVWYNRDRSSAYLRVIHALDLSMPRIASILGMIISPP